MNKKAYRVLSAVSVVVLLLSSFGPVLADSATNDTTGYNSTNETSVDRVNEVMVSNVSDAHIENNVQTRTNTGNNRADANTMGGSVQSGDAYSFVTLSNSANVNSTVVELNNPAAPSLAGNSITGADSDNHSYVNYYNGVNVWNDNTAFVRNMVSANTNTGGNTASMNTDAAGGVVQTGNADSQVGVTNAVNDSATSVTGLNASGDDVVGNSVTGYNSTNEASIDRVNEVMVSNISDAAVFNRVRARSNTGQNRADSNTMGGLVQSGNADLNVAVETDANVNTTMVDGTNDWVGDDAGVSGNSITGAESDNSTHLNYYNSFQVFNHNNKGWSTDAPDYCMPRPGQPFGDYPVECRMSWGVYNSDWDVVNTGGNIADTNTLGSMVQSGVASLGKYIRTCLNDSWTSILM